MLARITLALLLATVNLTAVGPALTLRQAQGHPEQRRGVSERGESNGPTRVLDLNGRAVNPLVADPRSLATVLVFTTTDCPISNRYAPEIQRLAARFGDRVRFVLVYPAPADTPAIVRDHVKRFSYAIDAVRDTAQELVKHTGVRVTPEVAVLGARSQVMYRGRIDDRYIELGRDRLAPTVHDLERALESVVAGKPVAVRETRAVGCILADLIK